MWAACSGRESLRLSWFFGTATRAEDKAGKRMGRGEKVRETKKKMGRGEENNGERARRQDGTRETKGK